MTEKDLISIWISGTALVVALYGILERGLAARRAFRIRLTEMIDDLAQIDVDQQSSDLDPNKSEDVKTALRNSNAMRRSLLAAQAVDVLSKYRRRITVPEYVILAQALRATSDTDGQHRVLELALANLRNAPPFQRAAAWRAWAWFHFERRNVKTAREAVKRSLSLRPQTDDIARFERVDILLTWFDYEFQINPTEIGRWSRVLDDADAVVRDLNNEEWRVDASARVTRARARAHADQSFGPVS